ncbi:hypothetical protein EV363DRAFT_1341326 [Boletus edulis]|nr:hypothetical protein EV363DRAFT_1341326 [Boletus edulis]
MYHAILLRMRWNKGMGGVLSNGPAYIQSRWHGRLFNQSKHVLQFPSALSIITAHVGVRPDRYDEAANYHYLVGCSIMSTRNLASSEPTLALNGATSLNLSGLVASKPSLDSYSGSRFATPCQWCWLPRRSCQHVVREHQGRTHGTAPPEEIFQYS